MNTSWWKRVEDLDKVQRDFIKLSPDGKLMLEGPPGSGKTNLLLLRAKFIAGKGDKNILIISYTNSLADFMRSGVEKEGLISGEQVRTFHSWASEHIMQYTGERLILEGNEFDEETRLRAVELLQAANEKVPTKKLYDGIFVDEAQDLTVQELKCLLVLSDKVCVCGDVRQGIYNRNGLAIADVMGLDRHSLTNHYRIGHRIAHVADRLLPPQAGDKTLESTSNYNPKDQGESTAKLHTCSDREEQFRTMLKLIGVQLDAFKGDTIGVFSGRKETARDIAEKFRETEFADLVCYHGKRGASFDGDKLIHVMTMHSAKGTEFRAVHLFGVEELVFPLNSRKLAYTAITRAKTALNAYRTGTVNKPLESAFAEPAHIELEDLFSEET